MDQNAKPLTVGALLDKLATMPRDATVVFRTYTSLDENGEIYETPFVRIDCGDRAGAEVSLWTAFSHEPLFPPDEPESIEVHQDGRTFYLVSDDDHAGDVLFTSHTIVPDGNVTAAEVARAEFLDYAKQVGLTVTFAKPY